MSVWRMLWCFYNSSAFKSVSELVLIGAFGIIIPALLTLPEVKATAVGDQHTKHNEFITAKNWTIIIGIVTMVLSAITPCIYFILVAKLSGETCNVNEELMNGVHVYIILLYITIALVLI